MQKPMCWTKKSIQMSLLCRSSSSDLLRSQATEFSGAGKHGIIVPSPPGLMPKVTFLLPWLANKKTRSGNLPLQCSLSQDAGSKVASVDYRAPYSFQDHHGCLRTSGRRLWCAALCHWSWQGLQAVVAGICPAGWWYYGKSLGHTLPQLQHPPQARFSLASASSWHICRTSIKLVGLQAHILHLHLLKAALKQNLIQNGENKAKQKLSSLLRVWGGLIHLSFTTLPSIKTKYAC